MDEIIALIIANVVTAIMFFCSEYLGWSKCQSNGLLEFMIYGIPCLPGVGIAVEAVSVTPEGDIIHQEEKDTV